MSARAKRLGRLIERHFAGAKLSAFEPLTGGVSADVTRLDITAHNGAHFSVVLREHGPNHDGHDAELEFAVLKALHGLGLAVPKPFVYDASCDLLGFPFVMMEYVDGSGEIREEDVEARIAIMADHLFEIHTASTSTLPELPLTIDPVPELVEWLPHNGIGEKLRALLRGLKDTSYTGELALVHGDFYPRNLIWNANGSNAQGSIRAVIDWEDASLGDPLFDVACSCMEMRYLYGKRGEVLFKQSYASHRSLDPFRLALWQAYAAAFGYRHMGNWRLEPGREKTMRKETLDTMAETAETLFT